VRNAGHRHFYRRGKVYYRVQGGVWTSLHTTDRREALKRLHEIEAQLMVAGVLQQLGIKAQLDRLEVAVESLQASGEGADSLAPSSAKSQRGEFEVELENFLSLLPINSSDTRRMYTTAKNNLLKTMAMLMTKEDPRVAALSQWEILEKVEPSGLWNALRENQAKEASNATPNHFATFLRKLMPDFAQRGFIPRRLVANALSIPKLVVPPRQPLIPTPAEMEVLLAACEKDDWELGQLIRFYTYSGARKGAAIGPKAKLFWANVDRANGDIVLIQKGNVRLRIPMGPQLLAVLKRSHALRNLKPEDRVFPFGSTKEDRLQEILKTNAYSIGGAVAQMSHCHALKHYFKTTHQRQRTPDDVSDYLTFNRPSGRQSSGNVYRHDIYTMARQCVETVRL
jgi:integrase